MVARPPSSRSLAAHYAGRESGEPRRSRAATTLRKTGAMADCTPMPAFVPDAGAPARVALGDVPEPEPQADEALVAVEAYSVNRGETFLLESPRDGWRPGQDVAGRVERAAADGSGPPAGTRVVAHVPGGGWAARVAAPTDALAALPDSVEATTASTLGVAGLTGLRLVRAAGALAGRRLLVTGASGGVGHFVAELAAAQGALVSAVSASAQRGERLRALGAAAVVTDVAEAEGPFDVIMESVGGPSLETAVTLLAPHATLLWFGGASRRPAALDFFTAVSRAPYASIVPWTYWRTGASDADDLATLVRLVAGGRLHPEIGVVEDWRRTPDVLTAIVERRVRGNAVLTVS
jgi:NADPH:quinone reductase-like Zn-dependent oxidoreductase